MIPESFIQELLNRVDIVDVVDRSVPLKKAGANYSACCPFHNEKTPSFTVSPTKQFYHCFGCGAHGTAIGFLMEHQGLGFVEAVHELAKMVGMIVPQETRGNARAPEQAAPGLLEIMRMAADYYKDELKRSERAIEYLKGRGLSGKVAAKYQIGYAPQGWQNLQSLFPKYDDASLSAVGLVVENDQGHRYDRFRDRIMFPIHDQRGQVIGFGGRVINPEDMPKYYNSPETSLFQKSYELYGLFLARRAIREAGRVLVVEGYMDVVALAQFGIEYAVAALGTATTPHHIAKLKRQASEIVFCFDGDSAGLGAAWRAAMNALPALTDGLQLRFLFLPDGHDPDSYIRTFGKEGFEAAMETAMPLSQYVIQTLSADNPLQTQEDKVRFLNEAEPILRQINAPRYALLLRKRIAELAGLTMDEMRGMVDLPALNETRKRGIPRQQRTTISLHRRFAMALLMQASQASEEDLQYLSDEHEEDRVLRTVIETVLRHPGSNPAALLHQLENRLEIRVLNELKRELHMLDESLDFTSELEGARRQLKDLYAQRKRAKLLDSIREKSLSQLTQEEREFLKAMNTRN
jgi:DNA primase